MRDGLRGALSVAGSDRVALPEGLRVDEGAGPARLVGLEPRDLEARVGNSQDCLRKRGAPSASKPCRRYYRRSPSRNTSGAPCADGLPATPRSRCTPSRSLHADGLPQSLTASMSARRSAARPPPSCSSSFPRIIAIVAAAQSLRARRDRSARLERALIVICQVLLSVATAWASTGRGSRAERGRRGSAAITSRRARTRPQPGVNVTLQPWLWASLAPTCGLPARGSYTGRACHGTSRI